MDVQALHTDDGILIRVPDSDEPPPTGIALIDPDEIGDLVTAEVGASALFASRFRECASRALLLPRRQPGRRTPLWQQRQRSAQLLEIASRYPAFPIVLETVRECLRDVFDVPALTGAAARHRRPPDPDRRGGDGDAEPVRQVAAVPLRRGVHVRGRRAAGRTARAGPVPGPGPAGRTARHRRAARAARSLRSSRRPSATCSTCRRAVAAATWRAWPTCCAPPGRSPRRRWRSGAPIPPPDRAGSRNCRGPPRHRGAGRGAADVGRDRGRGPAAGRARGAAAARGARGVHRAGRRPARRPGDQVRADARPVHRGDGGRPVRAGPRGGDDGAAQAGRGRAGWSRANSCPPRQPGGARLRTWRAAPSGATPRCCACCGGAAWPGCARRPSRSRRRCWPGSCPPGTGSRLGQAAAPAAGRRRADAGAVLEVVERLAGAPVPASALETLVLPGRVPGYSPALLDELTSAGEVVWSGAGALPGGDGWLVLAPADGAAADAPRAGRGDHDPGALGGARGARRRRRAVLPHAQRPGRGLLGGQGVPLPDDREVAAAIWDLVWAGLLTNDTLAPLRVALGGQQRRTPRRPAPGRAGAAAGAARPAVRLRAAGDADADRPADRQRPVVAAAGPRLEPAEGRATARPDRARARAGPDAAGAARRADQGRGRRRADPRRFRRGLPGAAGDGGGRAVPARVFRRGPRRGAVRAARRGGPDAGPGRGPVAGG